MSQPFDPAQLPATATCPLCKTTAFVCKTVIVETSVAGAATGHYEYVCACGATLNIDVPYGTDPSAAIEDYVATGSVPPGLIVSYPNPSYALGGYIPSLNFTSYARPFGSLQLPEPDEPEEPGPDLRALADGVVGYRAWNIRDWQLVGTGGVSYDPWVAGVNEAKCAFSTHASPCGDCACGLYAVARFDGQTSWWANADVLGAIEAWADEDPNNLDRFFVHGTGFRAQYAKIILLATSDDYPRAKNAAIRALATEHGADVCRREHLEDAAKEHGQLVPDDVLEWAKEGEPDYGVSGPGAFITSMTQYSNLYGQASQQVGSSYIRRLFVAIERPRPITQSDYERIAALAAGRRATACIDADLRSLVWDVTITAPWVPNATRRRLARVEHRVRLAMDRDRPINVLVRDVRFAG